MSKGVCSRRLFEEDRYSFATQITLIIYQGLEEVRNSNPDVLVVDQYVLALKLMGEGYKVFPLNYGGTYHADSFKVTMVNAVHTPSFSETQGVPSLVELPCGYVLHAFNDQVVYISETPT
ncbi:hypothetical protein [Rossellomorea sp. KS-H15a]|uniref:hypothetical protein n=1 Tax=Rossellomorea sp. KS-H15a TaxID=2963940 RepID=UPI0020C6C7B5|nr:hypothetical protein [Rossellomorea sp. KS-H15a]UTE77414.1 hypothetical protein M1J35_00930 [Rossellomorea sp. KS-H15a]